MIQYNLLYSKNIIAFGRHGHTNMLHFLLMQFLFLVEIF